MKIFVSIVSHGHQSELEESGLVAALNGLELMVRENKPEAYRKISTECTYFQNLRRNGFGANHNKNFEAAQIADEDWFVICNPDISTNAQNIHELVTRAEADGERIVAPYLFNEHTQQFDHNVRRRPTFINLTRAFLKLGGRSRYTDEELREMRYLDWCSGAFMAIKAGVFRELCGFDESYYMYMEDADLCTRSARTGIKIRFYGDIKMVHNAARDSGNILSRSFAQHLTSALRYFLKHQGN